MQTLFDIIAVQDDISIIIIYQRVQNNFLNKKHAETLINAIK